MWIVWFLVMLVGACMILSMFERPPKGLAVPLFQRDRQDCVVSRCIDDSGREICAGGCRR